MKTLQIFASVHANVHNHFNLERHLADRQTLKTLRSAALAEWDILASLPPRPAKVERHPKETSWH